MRTDDGGRRGYLKFAAVRIRYVSDDNWIRINTRGFDKHRWDQSRVFMRARWQLKMHAAKHCLQVVGRPRFPHEAVEGASQGLSVKPVEEVTEPNERRLLTVCQIIENFWAPQL